MQVWPFLVNNLARLIVTNVGGKSNPLFTKSAYGPENILRDIAIQIWTVATVKPTTCVHVKRLLVTAFLRSYSSTVFMQKWLIFPKICRQKWRLIIFLLFHSISKSSNSYKCSNQFQGNIRWYCSPWLSEPAGGTSSVLQCNLVSEQYSDCKFHVSWRIYFIRSSLQYWHINLCTDNQFSPLHWFE